MYEVQAFLYRYYGCHKFMMTLRTLRLQRLTVIYADGDNIYGDILQSNVNFHVELRKFSVVKYITFVSVMLIYLYAHVCYFML